MQKPAKIFTVILFVVLCMSVSSIAKETITLTTYYPAPYGNYEQLQATSMAVGSATSMPAGDGDLDVGGNVNAASYSVASTAGHTNTYTVVTSVDFVGQTVTTETITVKNGIVVP